MDSMDGLEEEEFHSKDTISQDLLPNLVDSFPPWKQWKDRWGALPFLLHIIFVVILLFIGTIIALTSPNVDSTETSSIEDDSSYFHTGPQRYNPYEDLFDYFTIALSKTELARIFSAVLLCGFLGEVLSVGFLLLILKFPNGMIYMCLLYSVGICFIVSILFFTIGGWFIGSVLVLVNILFFACFFLWRKRMEFSAVLLHAFTDVLVQIPHSLGITAGVVFIYFIWYLIWTATILISQQLAILGDGFVVIAFLYLMFSWYWTLQVFKNSVHIIVAGHVAYWYYDISQSNRYIVKNTLYRALVSFGSICIGSLIFPPIHVLRSITLKFSQLSNINPNLISLQRKLTVLCDAVLALFHFANVYGVAEMAMYGSSLRSSSQASLMVLLSYGVETMLHDSLVVNMVGLGAVMCSLITGLFASVGAWLMGSSYFFLVFLLTSLFGGSVFMLVSEVLYASGNSLFLCACRLSPDKLTKEFPKLITIIKDKYATRCLLVD